MNHSRNDCRTAIFNYKSGSHDMAVGSVFENEAHDTSLIQN